MIYASDPIREYKTNTRRLRYLSEKAFQLYEQSRDSSSLMRKKGFPIIGSSTLIFKNEVLTLVYSVMQHQINCELYEELLAGISVDSELKNQLMSLYEITNNFSASYHDFLAEWEIIKDSQKRKIIELNQLSVPA